MASDNSSTRRNKRDKPDFTECFAYWMWTLQPQDYGAPESRHLTERERAVMDRALRRSVRIVDHGK